MKTEQGKRIQDVQIIHPEIFRDFRGEYVETFNAAKYDFHDRNGKKINFVEDDISVSRKKVLRGLHGDDRTWKLIQCLYGSFYYVVVDMRKDSPSYLQWESFEMNDSNRMQVLVPAGCANGHLVLSDQCIFSYKQSEYYTGVGTQFTVKWDDPRLNISWPEKNPLLSQRDSAAPFIGEV